MPVGNDVVDLRDPEALPGAVHPRFDLRVFTARERDRLLASCRRTRLRWRLWAAKESAFKAAVQRDAAIRFLPRRFEVRRAEGAHAEVLHATAGRFEVRFEEEEDWIHAVALPISSDTPQTALELHEPGEGLQATAPSLRVRELARELVAPLLDLAPSAIRIGRTAGGIPQVQRGDRVLPIDLSLSHHGRLVACACISGRG